MTGFWRKAMMVWALSIALFGAVLMAGAFPQTDAIARTLFALMGGAELTMNAPLRFSIGLMGAVTFGWALMVLAAASVSHLMAPEVCRLLWRRISWAMAGWFVVDCAISLATGFGLNVASNLALTAAFVAILMGAGVFARDTGEGAARPAAEAA